jgi:hypothetical protein
MAERRIFRIAILLGVILAASRANTPKVELSLDARGRDCG